MAVAVRVSCRQTFKGSALRRETPASCYGEQLAEGCKERDSTRWNPQDWKLTYFSALVCHAFTGKRTGYPYSAGVAWTQGRFDDDDLHSCPEQTGARRSQPIGLPSADQEPMAHAELDGKFSS